MNGLCGTEFSWGRKTQFESEIQFGVMRPYSVPIQAPFCAHQMVQIAIASGLSDFPGSDPILIGNLGQIELKTNFFSYLLNNNPVISSDFKTFYWPLPYKRVTVSQIDEGHPTQRKAIPRLLDYGPLFVSAFAMVIDSFPHSVTRFLIGIPTLLAANPIL